MTRAAKHPTLPQNDSHADQEKRNNQLAKSRESYAWATLNTLPGVPLSAKVPSEDEPTLGWLHLVAGVALTVARNAIAVKLSGADKNKTGLHESETGEALRDQQRCDDIEKSFIDILKPPLPSLPKALFPGESNDADADETEEPTDPARSGLLLSHIDELRQMVDRNARGNSYEALFAKIPLPALAATFMEDNTFARLRVAGPNPMLLTGIDAMPAKFPVTEEHYQKAMGSNDSLKSALAEGRVYLLDYAELEILTSGVWQGLPKFAYMPMALFAVSVGGTSIKPVAIQCGQDSTHAIFTPSSDGVDQWGWQMAKTVVQVADASYHELYVHLARTHLVMEAFAVATRQHLAEVHPLWALLIPHFEGSLFINNAAVNKLISDDGPINNIFAGTIQSSQAAASRDRLQFDFYGKMPPADLAARKVDDASKLADYPYRDDALLVWGAIHGWAQQYINIYYQNDQQVTGDFELSAWVAALASEGKIKGFKAITTREQLADVCAMIMFTGSAQHAAVNFPQQDLMTYAPAISGAGWKAAPTTQAGHTKPDWQGYSPPISVAFEQLSLLYVLGSVHYYPLGEYRSNRFPFLPWFRDSAVTNNALPRFRDALKNVEARIIANNQLRTSPYVYLQPTLIPTSINI